MERRNAIKSMIALAVAPAIIKVEMLMPVKSIVGPYGDIIITYPEDGDWGIVVDCNNHTVAEVEEYLGRIYFGRAV